MTKYCIHVDLLRSSFWLLVSVEVRIHQHYKCLYILKLIYLRDFFLCRWGKIIPPQFSRKQMLHERWTILEYFNRVDFVYYTAIYVNI